MCSSVPLSLKLLTSCWVWCDHVTQSSVLVNLVIHWNSTEQHDMKEWSCIVPVSISKNTNKLARSLLLGVTWHVDSWFTKYTNKKDWAQSFPDSSGFVEAKKDILRRIRIGCVMLWSQQNKKNDHSCWSRQQTRVNQAGIENKHIWTCCWLHYCPLPLVSCQSQVYLHTYYAFSYLHANRNAHWTFTKRQAAGITQTDETVRHRSRM